MCGTGTRGCEVRARLSIAAPVLYRKMDWFEQSLVVLRVLGGDQRLQQVVEVPLDALAQHKAVVAGKAAGVVAGPENQVIHLRNHDQFLVFFH